MLQSVWKRFATPKRQPELGLVSQASNTNQSLPTAGFILDPPPVGSLLCPIDTRLVIAQYVLVRVGTCSDDCCISSIPPTAAQVA